MPSGNGAAAGIALAAALVAYGVGAPACLNFAALAPCGKIEDALTNVLLIGAGKLSTQTERVVEHAACLV